MKSIIVRTILTTALFCAPQAKASMILFSNLQPNSVPCGCRPSQGNIVGTFEYAPLVHWVWGNGFVAPTENPFALDSLFLPVMVLEGTSQALLLELRSANSQGLPDALVEQWLIDDVPVLRAGDIRFPGLTVNSISHPILTIGTLYWLLAITPAEDSGMAWFSSNLDDLGPTTARFNDQEFSTFRDDLRSAFAVYGTPVAVVPEPSPILLAAFGLILISVRWATKRR